ncbi:hypothetical protein A2U01_0062285, partial [Trifolium medium]|nr:hypothetical protein [Trifolium medium]
QSRYGAGFVTVDVWVVAIVAVLVLGCCAILGGGQSGVHVCNDRVALLCSFQTAVVWVHFGFTLPSSLLLGS